MAYVPAAFMKSGSILIKPSIHFFTGNNFKTDAGVATDDNGYTFDAKSECVTKYNDFYVINAKIPITSYEHDAQAGDFPEGNGKIVLQLFVGGSKKDYKGSIYVDDVALVVDDNVVSTVDFEDGSIGKCQYEINNSMNFISPRVVSFDGKALNVAETALTVKAGKTAKIKATITPATKVTYKSSNKKIVTVTNKGVVKGIKKGTTTITVKANGETVKVKVTVK